MVLYMIMEEENNLRKIVEFVEFKRTGVLLS